jgi:hypothetical protein
MGHTVYGTKGEYQASRDDYRRHVSDGNIVRIYRKIRCGKQQYRLREAEIIGW